MADPEISRQLENSVTPTLDRVDVSELVKRYESYARNTSENRQLQLKDWQYYHGKQYTREELEVFRARKQPAIVYNRIKPKVDFIRGYETKTRIDPSALPRNYSADGTAFAASDALRYASDVAKFDTVRSKVLLEMLVPGCGGAVLGVDRNKNISLTPVRADRFFYDTHSIEPDFSDAAWLGVVVWWNYDDIVKDPRYKNRRDVIDETMADTAGADGWDPHEDKPAVWNDGVRKRIRVVEMYYQDLGPRVDRYGEPVLDDEGNPEVGVEWHVCHFTKAGSLIDPVIIPWRDDEGHTFCPLVATSAYVDEENNRIGMVRPLICPQDEINKRRSVAMRQAMHRGFIFEAGAVEDPDETATELTKPDSKIRVREGAMKDGSFQIIDQQEMHQSQFSLYQDAKAEIDNLGPSLPVTGGAGDNRMSGRAILARQNIGSMELGSMFDNLSQWGKTVHERMWYMVRDLWTEEKWLRVRDSSNKEGFRFVKLNGKVPRGQRLMELVQQHQVPLESAIEQVGLELFEAEQILQQAQQQAQQQIQMQLQQMQQQMMQMMPQLAQQMPPEQIQQQMQQQLQMAQQQLEQQMPQTVQQLAMQHPAMSDPILANDIGAIDVDIIIDEVPDTSIAAQEEFLELMDMANKGIFGTPPHIQKAFIKNSNLRDKESFLQAIDKPPDPQQEEMQRQQIQMQMQQMQMVIQQMQAEIQKTQADAAYRTAQAQSLQQMAPIEAQQLQIAAQKAQADATYRAAQAQLAIPAQAQYNQAAAQRAIMDAQANAKYRAAQAQVAIQAQAQRDVAAAQKFAAEAQSTIPVKAIKEGMTAAKMEYEIKEVMPAKAHKDAASAAKDASAAASNMAQSATTIIKKVDI